MALAQLLGVFSLLALNGCSVADKDSRFPDKPSVGISTRLQSQADGESAPAVATCIDAKDIDSALRQTLAETAAAALQRIAAAEYEKLWDELYFQLPAQREAFQDTAWRLHQQLQPAGAFEQVDLRMLRFDGAYRGAAICGAVDTSDPAHLVVLALSVSDEIAFVRYRNASAGDVLVWLARREGDWLVSSFGEASHWLPGANRLR